MSLSTRMLLTLALVPLLLSTSGAVDSSSAEAAGVPGVRVDVMIDGRLAREYYANERIYVEAKKAREYAVRLSNDTSERVAVALSVDGLNTIDASHTSARDAAKWVLAPYESITVNGWQVSGEHARKFVFTSEERSYGAWIGDTRNLGLISAVVFGERTLCCREPVPYSHRHGDRDDRGAERSRSADETRSAPRRGAGKAGAPAQSAPEAEDRAPEPTAGASSSRSYEPRLREKKEDRAATGSGRKLRNEVVWTEFEMSPDPIGSVSVRYGFRDELVELGVLPQPHRSLDRREAAHGFAPDPGGAGCCR